MVEWTYSSDKTLLWFWDYGYFLFDAASRDPSADLITAVNPAYAALLLNAGSESALLVSAKRTVQREK